MKEDKLEIIQEGETLEQKTNMVDEEKQNHAVEERTANESTEEKQPEVKTKNIFREKIWVQMAKNIPSRSIRYFCDKTPFFKGHKEATKRLTELVEFKDAKLLMVCPDKSLKPVIMTSLKEKKEVLVPKPRLFSGLFQHLKSSVDLSEEKDSLNKNDIQKIQTSVNFDTEGLKVDLVVVGSVCVNRAGYRIGVGDGFVDLEYAILSKMKAVNENTIIVTTVHDCQVLDDLPDVIFESHDVPVDIIVTPTQTIFVNPKLSRPTDIIWSKVSQKRLENVPILKEIMESYEKEGKTVSLKEDDSDEEFFLKEKIRIKKLISKQRSRVRQSKTDSENGKENDNTGRRRTFSRKRVLLKSKENNTDSNNTEKIPDEQIKSTLGKPLRPRMNSSRHQIEFSLRLSNIAASVRVRDVKSALLERGVKPSNITWRGQRGFCLIHFFKLHKSKNSENQPIQVDSIVANLQQLKIGNHTPAVPNAFITVEPAEPISRIEVTDSSAV